MSKINLKDTIFKVFTNEIFISLIVFAVALYFVVNLTIDKVKDAYSEEFWRDVYVEAHGMLFDIVVISFIVLYFTILGEKRLENKRYQDEIDDFRHWRSEEATHRIVGNIKRLNRSGITKINLAACYLKNARLSEVQLQRAFFLKTNLQEANLINAKLQGAFLQNIILRRAKLQGAILHSAKLFKAILIDADLKAAELQGANLQHAKLQRAKLNGAKLQGTDMRFANLKRSNLESANLEHSDLMEADLRNAISLTVEQLSKVKTLYGAKLDPPLMKEIKKKYPHLLEKPKEATEEENEVE